LKAPKGPTAHGEPDAEQRLQSLDALLASVAKDAIYEAKAEKIEQLTHEFSRRIAAALGLALNAAAQAMPCDIYEEKKALARWVNKDLRRFDLAIRGPTGEPSIFWPIKAGMPPPVDSCLHTNRQKANVFAAVFPFILLRSSSWKPHLAGKRSWSGVQGSPPAHPAMPRLRSDRNRLAQLRLRAACSACGLHP
jgi:hypothetical protein